MAEVVSFDVEKASRYISQAMNGYLRDPPESDFQRGFLAALVVTYREGLGKGEGSDRLALFEQMTHEKE